MMTTEFHKLVGLTGAVPVGSSAVLGPSDIIMGARNIKMMPNTTLATGTSMAKTHHPLIPMSRILGRIIKKIP
jgi:hypothetical protein